MVRTALLALGFTLATATVASGQDVTINLSPELMQVVRCGELLTGFNAPPDDFAVATKRAAEGGYGVGYVMGYLHGALDRDGPAQALSPEELETFMGSYQLICESNAELSAYQAAQEALQFQAR